MDLKNYLKNHGKTYLIFDLDETLIYLILPWDLWEKDIEDELKKIDESILRDYQNRKINLNRFQNSYVAKYPKTKELLVKNALKFETGNLKDIQISQRLVKFIKEATGYQIFLWSSNTKPVAQKVLKRAGILNKFQKLVTCEETKFLKPEIDGFKLIWDGKTPKENYLFVGDSQDDKIAAKRAGIDFYRELPSQFPRPLRRDG